MDDPQYIIERDKTSLDISWIKDKSLTDLDNLPDPDVLANDIIENLKAGIESFEEIMLTVNSHKSALEYLQTAIHPNLGKVED